MRASLLPAFFDFCSSLEKNSVSIPSCFPVRCLTNFCRDAPSYGTISLSIFTYYFSFLSYFRCSNFLSFRSSCLCRSYICSLCYSYNFALMSRSSESSEKDVVSDSPGSEWICSRVLSRLLDI